MDSPVGIFKFFRTNRVVLGGRRMPTAEDLEPTRVTDKDKDGKTQHAGLYVWGLPV